MTTIVIQNPNETPIKKTKTTVTATNRKLVLIRQAVWSKVVDIYITGVIVYHLDNLVILVEDIARINAIGTLVGMMIVIVTQIGILMIMKIPKGLMMVIRIEEIADVQIDHHGIQTDEIEAEIVDILEEDIEMNRITEVGVIVKNLDRIEKQIHKRIRINGAPGIEEEIIVKIVEILDAKEHVLHLPVQDVPDKNRDLNHQ
jgi:formate dehydrogenase assembly factor FdhD